MEDILKKGVYILILMLDQDSDIQIGRLGKLHFEKGFYAYTGSALGTGGFKRVDRHFDVSTGKNLTRKWHIDYLSSKAKIIDAILLPTKDAIECKLARNLKKIPGISIIPGFGCTDCFCRSHLIYTKNDPEENIINICRTIDIDNIVTYSGNKYKVIRNRNSIYKI